MQCLRNLGLAHPSSFTPYLRWSKLGHSGSHTQLLQMASPAGAGPFGQDHHDPSHLRSALCQPFPECSDTATPSSGPLCTSCHNDVHMPPSLPSECRLSEGCPWLYSWQSTTKVYMCAKSIQVLKRLLRTFKFAENIQVIHAFTSGGRLGNRDSRAQGKWDPCSPRAGGEEREEVTLQSFK